MTTTGRGPAEKARGKSSSANLSAAVADAQRLIHELQVHQVELEVRNEELQRTREDLERAWDAAQAANRAKSAFLANMSHEIRTPLSGVVGMLALLRSTSLDDTQRRYAALAAASADQLLRLIGDILDFSKIEAGKLQLESVAFSPKLVVEESVEVLAIGARAKEIGLFCRVGPEVPSCLLGDPHRLRQVLLNLIGNAVKFTETGEVEVSACVDPTAVTSPNGPTSLLFTVRDTGIGIPVEGSNRLFQRFSQVDDSNGRRFGGAGLGLAIAKQLVERMGGWIHVQSEEGKGSTFSFSIPFFGASENAAEPEARAAACDADDVSPAEQIRILVAEDEPINGEVVVTYLRQRGWQVTAVADGRSAVDTFRASPFDVVCMDVQMPEMDGFEATRLIRAQGGPGRIHVPIIGLTAHALPEDRERCLGAGMDDYLAKPVDPDTLCALVERWAGNPSLQRPQEQERVGSALAFFESRLGGERRKDIRRTLAISLGSSLRNIQAALATEDLRQVAFWTHRMRGSLVVFGFSVAAGIAREIETLAAETEQDGLGKLVADLEQEFAQIEVILSGASGTC